MKKKIIWALATLSTFPLIATSCQSKTKNEPEQKPSTQNLLSEKQVKEIKELKHATKVSKEIYQEIEKSNPEDKLLTKSKSRIAQFFADFEAKLSKEIKSGDVQDLRNEFSIFLEDYLITIYIKYDYKDLRNHILKTFPDLKTKIEQVDIEFNNVSSRNSSQEKKHLIS